MLLNVNQHFIAYHVLTNQVQLLLTKPQFSTLYGHKTQRRTLHFDINLLKQLRNFLNYLERANLGFYSIQLPSDNVGSGTHNNYLICGLGN